jgi:hypothetical protein
MTNKVELNPAVQEQVDRMIADDYSDRAIVKALDSIGVKVSQPTINRYRNSTQAPERPRKETKIPDDVVIKVDSGIDTGKVLEEFKTRKHAGLARERMLEAIVNNQLAIVIAEQRRFIAGEVKYPFENVRALKELLTLFDSTRLKNSSQKEIDALLQNEKIDQLADYYYEVGKRDFDDDIEVDPTNVRIDTFELSALNLSTPRMNEVVSLLERSYLNGYTSRQSA